MSSQYPSEEQVMEEESNSYEDELISEDELKLDEEVQEEDKQELDKINKIQRDKESFVKQIKSTEKIQPNVYLSFFKTFIKNKLDSIELKINQLLDSAEKYASFLLSRHKQIQRKTYQLQQKGRHRVLVDEDDEIEEDNANVPTRLNKQPTLLKSGDLKEYQMTGLNWLISLYETGINGILADEMGLGKTIQTIALIGFLKEFKGISGPHLVVAPKSTLGNWMKEFKKWLPCCRVVKLIALKEERDEIINRWLQPGKFDVCLTSFEGVNRCMTHIKRFTYKYIIIDEAHKIKNEEAIISQNMRRLRTSFKLLLSGTPLQNSPHELWSLLNYLLPDLFDSSEVFDKWFEVNLQAKSNQGEDNIPTAQLEQKNLEMVQKFHKILRPFMLRRTKAEVERCLPPKKEIHLFVQMTSLQRTMYQNIITSNVALEGTEDKTFYNNKLMQLRKVCLHPYLFPEVEDKSLPALGEHLIDVSGKLKVLDKFLTKLSQDKERHQILIFSQFTMMLNVLEDYCNYREYGYCRIDGETEIQKRDDQIAEFTSDGSKKFVFLLSTRAGGLGINLATADTVIIYDSDFNPQMDLQAMDRAHRIGQKSQVMVYRIVCEHTVEEKIIERQQIKLRWDSLMIQQGRMGQQKNNGRLLNKDELREITMFGASHIFKLDSADITENDIDLLLERGEKRTQEMNQRIDQRFSKFKDKNLDLGLGQINIFDYFEENKRSKEDEEALDEVMALQMQLENKTRRDKKSLNYNLNHMFNAQIGNTKKVSGKVVRLQEHFLYKSREKLQQLLQKEEDYTTQQKFMKKFGGHVEKEEENGSQEVDQGGMTPEERAEIKELMATGFSDWTRQEFQDFIVGSEKYGRNSIDSIQEVVKTKTVEEVKKYKQAFWQRINDLTDKEKFTKQIERGEKMLTQRNEGQKLIEEKCKHFHSPRYELVFTPTLYNKFKSKYFSLENDRWVMVIGPNLKGKLERKECSDLIMLLSTKCKTENELKSRITSLLKVLEKEKENNSLGRPVTKAQPIEKPKVLQDTQKTIKKVSNKQEEKKVFNDLDKVDLIQKKVKSGTENKDGTDKAKTVQKKIKGPQENRNIKDMMDNMKNKNPDRKDLVCITDIDIDQFEKVEKKIKTNSGNNSGEKNQKQTE